MGTEAFELDLRTATGGMERLAGDGSGRAKMTDDQVLAALGQGVPQAGPAAGYNRIVELRHAVVSEADGTFEAEIAAVGGIVNRLVVVPGEGADQPSDGFDLTLLDGDGADVLNAAGADLSNAALTQVQLDPLAFVGNLTLTGANIGNAKSATVVVYVIR